MNILVIWFLLVDEWLHSSALIKDLASMADKSHSVTCVFPVVKHAPGIGRKNLRIQIVRLGRSLPIISYLRFMLAAIVSLVKEIRTADVVVIGANTFPLTLPFLLLGSSASPRRPIIVVRETSPPVETRTTRRYHLSALRHLSLSLSRFSDAIFAISPMHAEQIIKEYGLPRDKVHVWPSSFDESLFNPEMYSADRTRIRASLEIGDRFLLMYHGVLSPERGLSELVEALRRVREGRHDALLLFLGKGAAQRELVQQVVSSKLERAVFFHDQVDYADVPRFIAACDAGIVPLPDHAQWRYQVPTKLLEYTAMRKPVVITDMTGSRWVVGDRGGVFFCGHGTPAEIEKGILDCMAVKSEISPGDRDRIVERFSSSAVADSLIQIFTALLSRRKM